MPVRLAVKGLRQEKCYKVGGPRGSRVKLSPKVGGDPGEVAPKLEQGLESGEGKRAAS